MERTGARFVRLATVGDVASARLCAALLSSAGIESRVHGESLGPYPMTVGEMAVTEIWVSEEDLEEARELMLEAEVDSVFPPDSDGLEDDRLPVRALALGVAVILAAAVIRFLMRVF
jgi:hypothetical protein